jgi:formylglycine-generating enzyme required for sulfatase activity
MTFVLLPPGKFRMGSSPDEADRSSNETLHEVTLTEPFDLATTEVTQAQYEAVTGKNPSKFKGPRKPVDSVSWEKARDYGADLSRSATTGTFTDCPQRQNGSTPVAAGAQAHSASVSAMGSPFP